MMKEIFKDKFIIIIEFDVNIGIKGGDEGDRVLYIIEEEEEGDK
jgi:hypothetical protein